MSDGLVHPGSRDSGRNRQDRFAHRSRLSSPALSALSSASAEFPGPLKDFG